MTKIIIDALGSDQGPEMVAEALALAMGKRDFQSVVIGPEDLFRKQLKDFQDRIEFVDCNDLLKNTESPALAIRRHKTASMVQAFNRLNADDADVMLTAGSSGALLAGGYFITKRIPGVDRCPFLVTAPNTKKGSALLLDAGATMDSSAEMLLQYAYLADAYACYSLHRENPSVGLLNVGSEAGKGDKRAQEAYHLLEESDLNFQGNVEGNQLLTSDCDIIVTDGFTGNVALKTIEGLIQLMLGKGKKLYQAYQQMQKSKAPSDVEKPAGAGAESMLKAKLKEELSFFDLHVKGRGGAPLLGLEKPVYKAHGSSDALAFSLAIDEALDYAESHVEKYIADRFSREAKDHE